MFIIIIIIIIIIANIIFIRFVVHSFPLSLSLSLSLFHNGLRVGLCVCVRAHTYCHFSLVEFFNEQTNKQKIDEGKTRKREKRKCCLDKNLKKKSVVVVAVTSSFTHTHIQTEINIRKRLVSCSTVVLHQPFIIIIINNYILKKK